MHAWASISHYLDYKQDWDVPDHLRKSLNALSGLFYVADSEFQSFYRDSRLSQENVASKISVNNANYDAYEINYDNMTAYLHDKFSDRGNFTAESVSSLIGQLKKANISTIGEVDKAIKKYHKQFTRHEEQSPPSESDRFNAVGVVRITMKFASDKFRKITEEKSFNEEQMDE
ncbi:MAG TPA: hypothetical protein VIQ29_05125 [Ancylobacter sp.]